MSEDKRGETGDSEAEELLLEESEDLVLDADELILEEEEDQADELILDEEVHESASEEADELILEETDTSIDIDEVETTFERRRSGVLTHFTERKEVNPLVSENDPLVGSALLEIDRQPIVPSSFELVTTTEAPVTDEFIDFFSEASENEGALLLLDDEEEDDITDEHAGFSLDDSKPKSPRLMSNLPPAESSKALLEVYYRNMEELKRTLRSGTSTASEDSKALGEIVHRASLPFLTASQVSNLMFSVYAYKTKPEIMKEFLKENPLSSVNRMKLGVAVDQILLDFKSYKTNQEARRGSGAYLEGTEMGLEMLSVEQGLNNITLAIEGGNVCFVRSVTDHPTSTVFTCGNCQKDTQTSERFFNLIVHQNLEDKESYLKVFPKSNVCSHCGYTNVLNEVEHVKISSQLNSQYSGNLRRWFAFSKKKMTEGINVIKYYPEVSRMPTIYPAIFREGSYGDLKIRDKSPVSDEQMQAWYEETLDLMRILDIRRPDKVDGLTTIGERPRIREDTLFKQLEPLALVYCNMFNEDYHGLRTSAVNTLIMYIQGNPALYNALAPSLQYDFEKLEVYRGYLSLESIPDTEDTYQNILDSLAKTQDDRTYVKDHGEKAAVDRIRYLLSEAEKVEQIVKTQRKIALDNLSDTLPLAKTLDISGIELENTPEIELLLSVPEVVQWIDRASIMMIINKLSRRILDLWSIKSIPGYKNESLFNRSTKPFVTRVETTLKNYFKYYMESRKNPLGNLERISFDFLSVYSFSRDIVGYLFEARDSFDNKDKFEFYKAVLDISSEPAVDSFSTIKVYSFMRSKKHEAEEFFKQWSYASDLDYYEYHYGHMFSREEISDGLEGVPDSPRVKKSYSLLRLPGEIFSDYLDRLNSSTFDDEHVKAVDKDAHFFLSMTGILPSLYMLSEYIRAANQGGEINRYRLFMGDAIYNSVGYGSHLMYHFLGVEPPSASDIEEAKGEFVSLSDTSRTRIKYILQDLVFPSKDVNVVRGMGSGEDIFSLFITSPEIVEECIPLMGEIGELISEYYLG